MIEKLSWRQARDKLTGDAGDGLFGVNEAQLVLEDLVRFPDVTQFYRTSVEHGYLSYAGLDADKQPRYLAAGGRG